MHLQPVIVRACLCLHNHSADTLYPVVSSLDQLLAAGDGAIAQSATMQLTTSLYFSRPG
jgi:hypothetical protein